MARRATRGFSLIEILIVVIILGILAAIVLPQFSSADQSSRRSAFVADLRNFAQGATAYIGSTGQLPTDGASGELPPELVEYIREDQFEAPTPIGGVWDFEQDEMDIRSAFGVHFNGAKARDDDFMVLIDQLYDDGNLAEGGFRKLDNDRYYVILVP